MGKRIEKVKIHLKENKKTYLACGGTALVTVVGTLVYVALKADDKAALQMIKQIGFRNEANPTIITLIERSTPSKPVHLVGTNLYFNSLSEAARETGHDLAMLSKHVNGHIKDLKGDVFELLETAA